MMLLPMVAGAETVEIDGIYYELVSKIKEVAVTKKPSGKYTGSVDIPASVTYNGAEYSVTSIGDAFRDCSGLTSITITNSVTSIVNSAFDYSLYTSLALAKVMISRCRLNTSSPLFMVM